MFRKLLISAITLVTLFFIACNPEYVEPIDHNECIESVVTDTTMVQPAVYLDYPGEENGYWDEGDVIFSNYMVQLIDAETHEMMMEGFVPNWMGHIFKPVPPGTYYVRFMLPEGYEFIMMEDGVSMFDSDYDSDVISQDGYSDAFEIQCHEEITDIKAIIRKL